MDPEGLISRIGQVLHDDPRVLAAWLSGSRGRGSADRHSDLPPIEATRASSVAGHLACTRAFLPLARDLHDRCGLTWPTELEDAARRHLRAELDLELV